MNSHPSDLFQLLYNRGRWDDLEKALNQTHERLGKAGEESIWRFWRVALLTARGELDKADAEASGLDAREASQARRLLAFARAETSGDWSPVTTLLTETWQQTQTIADLFALCQIQLSTGNAVFVADHADELLAGVGTAEALRVAANGFGRSGRWSDCLRLLSENARLFPNGTLPSDLRRLQISAEHSLGRTAEALRHAEELAQQEENTENLALLFQLRVQTGRLKEATLPATQLVHRSETSPEILVQVSRAMRLEDRHLATAALSVAVERGVSGPQTVSQAFLIAHELGAEDLIEKIAPRFVAEAQKATPYLQRADLEATREIVRQSREDTARALTLWRSGRVPVHLLIKPVRLPLAWWPVQALAQRPEADTRAPRSPVFFRHGARPSDPTPRVIGKLYVDTTALINAHAMGILPLVEKSFGPLQLPPALRTSLVQQLDEVSRGQPDIVAGQKQVARLIEANRIEVWTSFIGPLEDADTPFGWLQTVAEAHRRGAALAGYWPKLLSGGGIFVPAEDARPLLTTATAIVDTLRTHGRITADVSDKAKHRLRSASMLPLETSPLRLGQPVFVEDHLAELLAQAGVLEEAARAFALVMADYDANMARVEASRHEGRERVAASLSDLLEHLRQTDCATDFPLRDSQQPTDGESQVTDAAMLCLEQLLQAKPENDTCVWVDDRFINAYERYGEVPIISTLGVIEELRRAERLSDADYFALRHRLREADFRYVPITGKEVFYHLRRATISGGHLIETPELMTLRRYLANVVSDPGTLQWPPLNFASPKLQGEIDYLANTARALVDTLALVFRDDGADAVARRVHADWVRRFLWLAPEVFNTLHDPAVSPVDAEALKTLAGLGDDLLLARAIDFTSFGSRERRSEFLTWVEQTYLLDESRQQAAARHVLKNLEINYWREGATRKEREVKAAIMSDWYLALPVSIRARVQLPSALKASLGVGVGTSVNIGGTAFEAKKFWHAAGTAYLGKPVSLEDRYGSPYRLRFTRKEDEGEVLLVERDDQSQPMGIRDDSFLMFNPDSQQRLRVLHRHPEWLDTPKAAGSKNARRLARMPNEVERIMQVEEARADSAWYYYTKLEKSFSLDPGPSLEAMAPPKAALLRHYLRLPRREATFSTGMFQDAARKLVKEVGVPEAICRLATLPRVLPPAALAAFDALSVAEQDGIIVRLRHPHEGPLAQAQALRLTLRREGPQGQEPAHALLTDLLTDESSVRAGAFLQVLLWSWRQLGLPPQAETMTAAERLVFAWTHAGRLFPMVHAVSTPEAVQKFFTQHNPAAPAEFLAAAPGEDDIAGFGHVKAKPLVVTAIASALLAEGRDTEIFVPGVRAAVENWCFQRAEDLRWPQISWLNDPAVFPDLSASFFSTPRDQLLTPLLGSEAAAEFAAARITREIDALLNALELEPGNGAAWILLNALLGAQNCPLPLRGRMRDLLERTDLTTLDLGEPARLGATLVFAGQACRLRNSELVARARAQIAGFARWCCNHPGDANKTRRRQNLLVHAAQTLSHRATTGDDPAGVFAATVLAILDAWPQTIELLVDACDVLVSLPPEQLVRTSLLLLRIRRDATRNGATVSGETSPDEFTIDG